MEQGERVSAAIMDVFHRKYGHRAGDYLVPPPAFTTMEGEFLHFDLETGELSARFPVRERHLNPYHAMQGGMIAAAFDNALGPLSMLIAPPNVTRRLEITYSRPITLAMEFITVEARLTEREGRFLTFKADLRAPDGRRLARARAKHFILDQSET
jgi:acyl-coenzyme A thioesterase PaaI-like protein